MNPLYRCIAGLDVHRMFFMQSPSFLDYQRRMQKECGRNNASTLFGVHQIPSTQQICNLLDPIAPAQLAPVFFDLVEAMRQSGALAPSRGADGRVLIALDGTDYHGSASIHCEPCSTRTLANGKTQYYHVAVTPVIVAPGQAAVWPLAPEFVQPQDGQAKQDGELNASIRWLQHWGTRITPWRPTLLGDDLYCHQPFCEQVLAHGCAFLFVCLPPSHPLLYEWVADFERTGDVPAVVKHRWTGTRRLTDTYRWLNDLPLRDHNDAMLVSWCELITTDANGTVLYRNAWASSERITAENVIVLVAAGRRRWNIENENNNTLKTKGYQFETQLRSRQTTFGGVIGEPDAVGLPRPHHARSARPTLPAVTRAVAVAPHVLRTSPRTHPVPAVRLVEAPVRLHAQSP